MEILLILLLLVSILILVCLAVVAFDVRSIRSAGLPGIEAALQTVLRTGQTSSPIIVTGGWHLHQFGITGGGYFVVWEWRNGAWHLNPRMIQPDADPGSPPDYPGTFEKQHVRMWVPESP